MIAATGTMPPAEAAGAGEASDFTMAGAAGKTGEMGGGA